jgi:hypothetical protein
MRDRTLNSKTAQWSGFDHEAQSLSHPKWRSLCRAQVEMAAEALRNVRTCLRSARDAPVAASEQVSIDTRNGVIRSVDLLITARQPANGRPLATDLAPYQSTEDGRTMHAAASGAW